MLSGVREQVTAMLSQVSVSMDAPLPTLDLNLKMQETRVDPALALAAAEEAFENAPRSRTVVNQFSANDPATWANTPRNALCPCGSSKKYKQCHGAV